MSTPLQLENFFVESLTYTARRGFDPTRQPDEALGVDWNTHGHEGDASRFMTRLRLEIGAGEAKRNSRCELSLSLVGLFKHEAQTSARQRSEMANLNAPSILYGVARQVVAETTGNGPWGKVLLPAYNFVEHVRAKSKPGPRRRQSDTSVLAHDAPRRKEK